MDSSASAKPEDELLPGPDSPPVSQRAMPSRWHSIRLIMVSDLKSAAGSWLCRGFLLASSLLSVLALKGMQAEQQPASQMLEAVYVSYILIWMHGVIFIAGGALSREQDCLGDAILSRGLTRGEYLAGKLAARSLAVLLMMGGILLPVSLWAIRQDQLMRTEIGQVVTKASNTLVEPWEPQKVFAGTDGNITELSLEVGNEVRSGDILAQLDDRKLFDSLETERRAEENARNEVANAQRHFESVLRSVDQAEDALAHAEGALTAMDLLSKREQTSYELAVRSRKRELTNARNQVDVARDAIAAAENSVENAQARVREARKRLAHATVTAPVSGYITERNVQAGQYVGLGAHLCTIAPLDEYRLDVPVYNYKEFKRLKSGLPALINIQGTEHEGTIDRLGATTKKDRWGGNANYVIVRFKGDGTLGLLGRDADVRLSLPPPEQETNKAALILNTLTGRGTDDLESRTASVTPGWMLVSLGKVLGCALMVTNLAILTLVLFRSTLMGILLTTALWHVSNLIFDFAGLKALSYVEIVRTLDKTLAGIAIPWEEATTLLWLTGITLAFGVAAMLIFINRDPQK